MCCGAGVVTSLVTEFAELDSLEKVLMALAENDANATTSVLLTTALQAVDVMLPLNYKSTGSCTVILPSEICWCLPLTPATATRSRSN